VRDRLISVPDREALIADARTAYGRHDWPVARSRLLDADADGPLEAEDLERLAWSCRWVSDEAGFLNALERGHSEEMARWAVSERADAVVVDGAKALAMTGVDVWLDAELRTTAWEEQARRSPAG
jgi:hypothetical protein